jgi:hypothetical protein
MKKNLTFLGTIILSSFSLGQVGINTKDPKATMDIVASANDLSVTDGLIAPRLTTDQLRAKDNLYNTAQDGTIVYINTLSTGAISDKTTNINSIGYYYFDKTQGTAGRWMKIANPTSVTAYQEPWNVQGGITSATLNNQAIYQNNSVAIKKQTGINGADLDVAGAIRGGNAATSTVGANSIAVGSGSQAITSGSIALGPNAKAGTATADNNYPVAIGNNANAANSGSYALGNGAKTGIASDGSTYSRADHSYAIGEGATTGNNNAYALGKGAKANGNHSMAIGEGIITNTDKEVAVGKFNKSVTNAQFEVGIGTNDTNRKNAITVLNDGKTGINVDAPTNALHINSLGATVDPVKIEGLRAGTLTDEIVTIDTNGNLKKVAANTLPNSTYLEPWNNVATNQGATSNSQDIYQMGKVGVGITSPQSNLHVNTSQKGSDNIRPLMLTAPDMEIGDQVYIKIGKADNGSSNAGDIKYNYQADTDKNYLGFGSSGKGTAMAVLGNGSIGMGTTTPTAKLDVNGRTRLRDQVYDNNNMTGISGQVLSTNAQGKVVWLNNVAITPARAAVFPRIDGSLTSLTAQTRLGTTLTLPPGKWSIDVTLLLLKEGDSLVPGQAIWVRLTFSDDASGTGSSTDIIGSKYASGSLIGPMTFGLINGTVIINNSSGADKTYYLTKNQQNPYKWGANVDDNLQLKNLGSGVQSEDQIVAYPMN